MTGALTNGGQPHLSFAQASGATAEPQEPTQIDVPSGQSVTLHEVIWNEPGPEGLTVRFRFVAPQIAREGGDVDFDTAAADMLYLCDSYAMPRVATSTPQPSQIIISLAAQATDFGEAAPEITQFFEAYSIEDGICIWEAF